MWIRSVAVLACLLLVIRPDQVFSDTVSGQASAQGTQEKTCKQDVTYCSDEEICKTAVASKGKNLVWATASAFQKFVVEAKARDLECTNTCSKDVASCSDKEICLKALKYEGDSIVWTKEVDLQDYVSEAKSRNIECRNIFTSNSTKVQTVANADTRSQSVENGATSAEAKSKQAPPIGFDWKTYDPSTFISSMVSKFISAPLKFPERDNARVYLDFNGDGIYDYFVAAIEYNIIWKIDRDPATARKSNLRFYRGLSDGTFKLDKEMLSGDGIGCLHPRKAVVNDFNSDNRPDIFVACHGWDDKPFPGESSQIILSQPNGTFSVQDIFSPTGYAHSAASADFNADGIADILVNDSKISNPYQLWIGKGDGSFTKSKNLKLKGVNSQTYFSTEVFDYNGDGLFDLFVSGEERENESVMIFLNKSEKGFTPGKRIDIPAVKGAGSVLDALGIKSSDGIKIYVLRTGDRSSEYYTGVYIQEYDIETAKSKVVYESLKRSWFPWLVSLRTEKGLTFGSDDSWEKPVDGR
jgi:hypothetical protein